MRSPRTQVRGSRHTSTPLRTVHLATAPTPAASHSHVCIVAARRGVPSPLVFYAAMCTLSELMSGLQELAHNASIVFYPSVEKHCTYAHQPLLPTAATYLLALRPALFGSSYHQLLYLCTHSWFAANSTQLCLSRHPCLCCPRLVPWPQSGHSFIHL